MTRLLSSISNDLIYDGYL